MMEISCDNISKSFSGKTIFKNLSFKLSSTQSLTITGSNGSGKSTLIKVIANLITASKGKVTVRENETEIPRDKLFQRTGLLSPYLNLYDELTGFENLDFFYRLKNPHKKHSLEKIKQVLQRVNLYGRQNDPVKNYSSGMKQKLKLAFAILHEPEILLLDEPRTNLDKEGVDLILEIADKQKQKGILLIATNDENDIKLCDGVLNIQEYK